MARTALALLVAACLLAAASVARPASAGVIQLPWEGSPDDWRQSRDRLAALDDAALAARIQEGAEERRLYLRPFEIDVAACVALWERDRDTAARDAALRALAASLGPLAASTEQSLAGAVTAKGSIDAGNLRLRDAAYHFALRHHLSGEPGDARRAAAILAAFAAAVPQWPAWSPYYETDDKKRPLSRTDPQTFRGDYAAGLWGGWIYQDLVNALPLMQAFRWIESSGEVDGGSAASALALFRLFLDVQRSRGGAEFTNMDAFKVRGLVAWGILMEDPAVVHEGIWHLRSIFRAGFFPDGWWHEGSPVYHSDLVTGLRSVATGLLAGYSDPAGYSGTEADPRIDRLDPASLLGERGDSALRLIESMTLPTGSFLAVHDTDWRTTSPVKPPASRDSVLHGCFGQASLSCGPPGQETVATLHWSGSGVHAHLDALNLNLWAKGMEVISETQYQPVPGSDSTREWHTSTAGHATVVIDERSQGNTGPRGRRYRDRSALDAIPGVPDWPWRFRGENANDFGRLRLYNSDFPHVKVVEAEAPASYESVVDVKQYSRTLALVRIDSRDAYLVDIFRVAGGTVHDYMLHANLQDQHEARTTVRLAPRDGRAHGYLNSLRSGKTDGLWLAEFLCTPAVTLNTFVCGAPGTEVFLADGPAMRRPGSAPFLFVRRGGDTDCFVAVHHVTQSGPPRIKSIEQLPTSGPDVVALRVTLEERVDTIVSCTSRDQETAVTDKLRLRARFAHVADSTDAFQRWAYMVDGDMLQSEVGAMSGDTAVAGTVVSTDRRDAGAPANAIVTDVPVPLGPDARGQSMVVDLAGLATWGFELTGSSPAAPGSQVLVRHDPGFTVDGQGVKQVAFPNWGSAGKASFRVPGSGVLTWDRSGQASVRATGACALVPGR